MDEQNAERVRERERHGQFIPKNIRTNAKLIKLLVRRQVHTKRKRVNHSFSTWLRGDAEQLIERTNDWGNKTKLQDEMENNVMYNFFSPSFRLSNKKQIVVCSVWPRPRSGHFICVRVEQKKIPFHRRRQLISIYLICGHNCRYLMFVDRMARTKSNRQYTYWMRSVVLTVNVAGERIWENNESMRTIERKKNCTNKRKSMVDILRWKPLIYSAKR